MTADDDLNIYEFVSVWRDDSPPAFTAEHPHGSRRSWWFTVRDTGQQVGGYATRADAEKAAEVYLRRVAEDTRRILMRTVRRYGRKNGTQTSPSIKVRPSPTADTRTCDPVTITKQTLLDSSVQHIDDVRAGLRFFVDLLQEAADRHDYDKISDIDGFHADFVTGFQETGWWDRHRKLNRHHLQLSDGIPADVNLIDVLDMIADCVMAGMARSGRVYPLEIGEDVLRRAFDNTVNLLMREVVVVDPEMPR